MKSIQILTSYKVETIKKADIIGGYLVLEGGNYSRVKYVLVNNVKYEELLLEGRRLKVTVPSTMTMDDVKFIYPISETEKIDASSILQFNFGPYPKKLEGASRLVQLFIKTLFTTPGTNLIHRTLGGGLPHIMSKGYGMNQLEKVVPDLVAAVTKTEKDIRDMQASLRMAKEEILVSARLVSATPEPNSGSIDCVISLTTQSGKVDSFSLAF